MHPKLKQRRGLFLGLCFLFITVSTIDLATTGWLSELSLRQELLQISHWILCVDDIRHMASLTMPEPYVVQPWHMYSLDHWGDPFAALAAETANPKTLLIFRNLHHSVNVDLVWQTIRRYSHIHDAVRLIIREPLTDDTHHPHQYKAIALLKNEQIASRIAQRLDGCALMGIPIRVYLRRISERNDIAPDEPWPGAPRLYRVPSNDDSSTVPTQDIVVDNFHTSNALISLPDSTLTFHNFPKLPAEIRIMIWKEYFGSEPRRIVQIQWRGSKDGFKCRVPVPVFLQINQESRLEAQKHWGLAFGSKKAEPSIRISYSNDFIYLTDSVKVQDIGHLTLARIFDQLSQEELNCIKCIHFDYGLWFRLRGADRPTATQFRVQLPSLRSMKIVQSNGLCLYEDGSARIDHLPMDFKDATKRFSNDPNARFLSLYTQIKRAFAHEARAFPEWKPPSIYARQITRGGKHLELILDTNVITA